MMHFGNGDKPN